SNPFIQSVHETAAKANNKLEFFDMPIYEYMCSKCGSEFEMLVKSSSEKVNCPKCSDSKVQRKLSVFSASVSLGSKSPCSMVES
ncbi:MAG: zinc ribbon domain-containing protein, partial [Lentisphaerae bacterium]|nr:zinc ribbon domain-containing protein [Lentisphaerota bacterium]